MPQMTIQQAMGVALEHCRAGQWPQAEAIYRQVLQVQPNLGDAWANLGMLLQQTGRIQESVLCHERALRLRPQSVELMNNLAGALAAAGRLEDAERLYRQAISAQPQFADTYVNLGSLLRERGRVAEAAECCKRATALRPDSVPAHYNLGIILKEQGKLEEAIGSFRRAIALFPQLADAYAKIGRLLHDLNRPEEAVVEFQRAISLSPNTWETHYNLGVSLAACRRPDEAAESYRRAIGMNPQSAEAHENLANVLLEQGRLDEAIAGYRTALGLKPDNARTHSNLIYALQLHPRSSVETMREAHRQFEDRHARPLYGQIRPHTNDRAAARRLSLAYVSPDLHEHIIGRMMEVILANHDHERFHIACYSDGRPDALSARLQSHVDLWRDTAALDHAQLAERIRRDEIEILVDLSVHSCGNRLLAFARKPAPVQVTYLGYPGSTGLEVMDFRLTDPYLSPEDQRSEVRGQRAEIRSSELTSDLRPLISDSEGPEKLIYLPRCYWPYNARADAPPVNELPAMSRGRIAFGCFNNFTKVNEDVIGLWCAIMQQLPESRLYLLINGGTRNEHVYRAFERQGFDRRRILLVDRQPSLEYLRLHHEVDIALDPFPYNGHTTSYDALYMGVPVVSLAGQRAVSRAGVSILSNVGLTELIAQTPEEYVKIATELAGDLPRLSQIRRTLRERMRNSALMDAPGFCRDLEAAYREIWMRWCRS